MLKLIDIHAHLDDKLFENDREKIIKECENEGILIVNCGSTPESNKKILKYLKYKNVKLCMGIYPMDALKLKENDLFSQIEFIEKNKEKIIGIGEVGLDYYWIKENYQKEREREIFKEFIWLANRLGKFLNVHTRKAEKDAIKILSHETNVPVVLHYFSGNMDELKEALDNGFFISINTIIIKSRKYKKIVEKTPIEKIFSETDSPYGLPGKRNDPRNIKLVIKEISKIKEMEIEEVEKAIVNNYKKITRAPLLF